MPGGRLPGGRDVPPLVAGAAERVRRAARAARDSGRPSAPALRLSVVVVAHDMARELPRTLASLAPGYQRNLAAADYEVIVVDNGSTLPATLAGAGPNARLVRLETASASPVAAVNRGLAEARGAVVSVLIDGARMVSPGILHFGAHAAELYPTSVVVALNYFLGFDYPRFAAEAGYDEAAEDALLDGIDWTADGYNLFDVATLGGVSTDGWFGPMMESNCLTLTRATWARLGGADARFATAGGGFVNPDLLRRALELPDAQLVVLLGEGSFHQMHGGVSSALTAAELAAAWERWAAEYAAIRGRPYARPVAERPTTYLGTLPPPVLRQLAHALSRPAPGRAHPLGDGFDPGRWSATAAAAPVVPEHAEALELVHAELLRGASTGALAAARLLRRHAPHEPEPARIAAMLASWLPREEPAEAQLVEYHLALGDASRVLGDPDAARAHYEAALARDPGLERARRGLEALAPTAAAATSPSGLAPSSAGGEETAAETPPGRGALVGASTDNGRRYAALLKDALLGDVSLEAEVAYVVARQAAARGLPVDDTIAFDPRGLASDVTERVRSAKALGHNIDRDPRLPTFGLSMMGRARLDQLHVAVDSVLDEGVPGDLVECGVWRGGGTILMRGLLAVRGVRDRTVWVADSFAGVPAPDNVNDHRDLSVTSRPDLAVSRDRVEAAFDRFGLLDEQVRFLPGWFSETLPEAPIERIAVLRLDGDLYLSTMDALTALYDRVSPRGFVIIDDYGALPECARATDEFRAARGITAPLERIDWTGFFWRVPS